MFIFFQQIKLLDSQSYDTASSTTSGLSIAKPSVSERNDRVQQLWSRSKPLSECESGLRKQLNERFGIEVSIN